MQRKSTWRLRTESRWGGSCWKETTSPCCRACPTRTRETPKNLTSPRGESYTVIESTQTGDLVSHGWNIRQESIDLLQVNLGCLSWAVLQSFMLVQAPIGKHEHQGHVLSRAAFVATDGLPDNIYMTNTMKWKGAKETKSENIVAVRVPIMHCHGRLPRSHRLTLDMLSAAKQQ